ncbi:MAG TPA: FAD-binding oxidoreductase, partial [Candidatus Polarisedimenticolaceae bacterium]|nr:FAD-binding oxidoreductase [Candidatus Polarisedimenticolaceae bacterium]
SNLFRYEGRRQAASRLIDLRHFNQPLYLDPSAGTLDVQGLTTFEDIVDFTLPHGLVPVITPELKHITIGGATVGIGIETNSFRYGFVHDSLLEADVLLPHGEVVTAAANNEYADLFHGLPNSYGTLGYILRAKIKLHPVKPYVLLTTERYHSINMLVAAMDKASKNPRYDYLESMAYAADELYLTTVRHTDQPQNLKSIYGPNIFYRQISQTGIISLRIKDYMFRYDPEWFWALPDSGFYQLFRRFAPKSMRNSGFYARSAALQGKLAAKLPFIPGEDENLELLIQDWEVPWKHAEALLSFAFDNLDLAGRPLMSAPVKTPGLATSYPMDKNQPYLNLGSYSFVKKQPGKPAYHSTKIMDKFTFAHDGIKMLYSTTFLSEAEFKRIYNDATYRKLKAKYDPNKLLPTLYEKTVKAY